MDPISTVREFIGAINRHDVDRLLGLMSSGHELVDGTGEVVAGADCLRSAWLGYFAMFPDYTVRVEKMVGEADWVGVFGRAEGTYAPGGMTDPARHWSIPAAWLAVLAGDRVTRWQVYADNGPVREMMRGEG